MQESFRHKGLRNQLVQHLKTQGISDEQVLMAISRVPRHRFLDEAFADWAYKDVAFPIDSGQTISQPYTVAVQSTLLEVKKGDKILEIGTGSGYQAAVLYEMGAKIYSIERQEKLFHRTYQLLIDLGYGGIRTIFGDGYAGLPKFAPFDKIIVTAGASEIPETLLAQLKVGGMMVIPVGDEDQQQMLRIIRKTETSFKKQNFGDFSFVPFLKGVKKEE